MPGRGKPFQKGVVEIQVDVQRCWVTYKSSRGSDHRKRSIRLRLSWTIPKAPPAARVAAANSFLDRGYGKPTQPISQTLTKIDPSTMSDAELATIVRNGMQADDRPH